MPSKIEFDLKLVKELAAIRCTDEEMANVLGVCIKTIHRYKKYKPKKDANGDDIPNFKTAYETGQIEGKLSIRRKQFQVAMKGNPAMLIFLGKQWLKQSDKLDLGSKEDNPLPLGRAPTPEQVKKMAEEFNKDY